MERLIGRSAYLILEGQIGLIPLLSLYWIFKLLEYWVNKVPGAVSTNCLHWRTFSYPFFLPGNQN